MLNRGSLLRLIDVQNLQAYSNSPINPLYKVVALNLEKHYVRLAKSSKARIRVSLNFKRSSDLQGLAISNNGEEITVGLTLSIMRASFEISVCYEQGGADGISLSDVAFASRLEKKLKVVEHSSLNQKSESRWKMGGGLRGRLGFAGRTGSGEVHGNADKSADHGQQAKATITSSYEHNNISVTFAGNVVHWEFSSEAPMHQLTKPSCLHGEVFLSKTAGLIDACSVSWPNSGKSDALRVVGSVFTSTQDMDVEDVKFLSSEGVELSFRNVARSDPSITLVSLLAPNDDKKRRLAKQIIRKYLVSQGMRNEGTRVEICRAVT